MAESPPSPSPSRPFQLLADDLTWFIKCPELRVFHVTTSPADRALVLALVARTEGHAHNRSPYFVLEESITSDDIGFRSRAHRIAATHAERRALLAKEGIALDPVAEVDDAAAPVVAFAGQLDGCLRAQANAKELHGLTVVLAPTIVQKGTTFVDELVRLVRTPQLALVRWILIEVVPAPLCAPLQSALGEAMLTATALVPEAERRADMEARLAGMAAAPAGASPQVQLGFAGPRNVIAPPRFANLGRNPQSPEVKALLAKELGPLAALVGEGGALLRRQIAGAALAARDGRHAEAAALQAAACTLCLEAGLVELGCILEMTLGTYVLAGGERTRAVVAFQSAAARAHTHGLVGPEAQAYTALGALYCLLGDLDAAVKSYRRAAELAQDTVPTLAIEAYRCAGQVALDAGALEAATTLWTRALAVANSAPPAEIAASSAPTVARALAKVLQGLGSFAAAQSLIDQAERLENPTAEHAENAEHGSGGA